MSMFFCSVDSHAANGFRHSPTAFLPGQELPRLAALAPTRVLSSMLRVFLVERNIKHLIHTPSCQYSIYIYNTSGVLHWQIWTSLASTIFVRALHMFERSELLMDCLCLIGYAPEVTTLHGRVPLLSDRMVTLGPKGKLRSP